MSAQTSVAPPASGSTIRPGSSLGHGASNVTATENTIESFPRDSDHRLEKLWADYESVESYLGPDVIEETVMDVKLEYASSSTGVSEPFQNILPVELYIPNRDSTLQTDSRERPRAALEDGPALIILTLVTANIRNCSLPSSNLRALDVFLALSCHLTDEAKVDRMVPYIVELLHDDAAPVRSAALRTLMQVLMLVTVITPSNAAIFPEYHSEHQVSGAGSRGVCEVYLRTVYCPASGHSCAISRNGTGAEGAWNVQAID